MIAFHDQDAADRWQLLVVFAALPMAVVAAGIPEYFDLWHLAGMSTIHTDVFVRFGLLCLGFYAGIVAAAMTMICCRQPTTEEEDYAEPTRG